MTPVPGAQVLSCHISQIADRAGIACSRRTGDPTVTVTNPETRYHCLQVTHVEPCRIIVPSTGPIGRRPVLFAGKCPEVLKEALAETDSPLKLY